LNERALLIDQATRVGLDEQARVAIGADGDPISLWKQILEGKASVAYKLNAANNIVFFYLEANNDVKVAQSLKTLTTLLDEHKFKLDELPNSVQDTILSARLMTGYYRTPAEIAAARKQLEQIKRDPYVQKRPIRRGSA
jgi:hypothetical protein